MDDAIERRMAALLQRRKDRGTFRQLHLPGDKVDFSSNDYLGFATDGIPTPTPTPPLLPGAKASRLISGNLPIHQTVENLVAQFHHAETGLLFNSGYDANVGLLGCVAQPGDIILYDTLCHASIRDGLMLSRASKVQAFRHNDIAHLQALLQAADAPTFVVTEGLFSMDGDTAPLLEITDLCQSHSAALIVDEAHSGGVLGPQGKGWVCALGLEDKVFARVHTFGKALGCHGAVVLGSPALRDYLINYARSFIFTTAPPPHSAWAIQAAYQALAKTPNVGILQKKVQLFRNLLEAELEAKFLPSQSPIQSWIIPDAQKVRQVAQRLQEQGFDVRPIVAPTVPLGQERIRFCIHAFNTDEEIQRLVACLASAGA